MGMTDRQFDLHLSRLLRDLKRIKEEVTKVANDAKIRELDELIKDIEEALKRP